MVKYAICFSKYGAIRYTSHLDLFRLFKRAFRRTGIAIRYSQGFNPHPKMGFAQPLSLGYTAEGEYIEFETEQPISTRLLKEELKKNLPEGVGILQVVLIPEGQKSMAASVEAAEYTVDYPIPYDAVDADQLVSDYLAQPEILAMKRQKKTKALKEVDIRSKIRSVSAEKNADGNLRLILHLDCGSASNLSPELVIQSFAGFASINCERWELAVCRRKLLLPLDYKVRTL